MENLDESTVMDIMSNAINSVTAVEQDHSISEEVVKEKKIYKRKFGSGTKSWTPAKRAQCPVCKYYFNKLNASHLKLIHKMTVEELAASEPEKVKFFTEPYYAVENSDYALSNPEENVLSISETGEDLKFDGLEAAFKDVVDVFIDAVKEDLDFDVENFNPFTAKPEDKIKAEKYGHFLENIKDTPKRVAKAYEEMLSGMIDTEDQVRETLTKAAFPSKYSGAVTECNIKVIGMCPHHLLPIKYIAHVSYMPGEKTVGLSKLPRTVEILAKRLVLQEDLTEDIANAIMKHLEAKGVAVMIEGSHGCLAFRGADQPDCITTTTVIKGVYQHNLDLKNEFFSTIDRRRGNSF